MKKILLGVAMVPLAFVALFLLLFAGGPQITATTTSCTVQSSTATGKLSAGQVASIAYSAGWRGNDLTIAVAITMPESGADTTAVQQGQPAATTGWGLWQDTPCDQSCLDPAKNAQIAFGKYKAAHGFSPWTTYTGGEYLRFMPWAATGVAHMTTAGLSCQASPKQSAVQDDVANATAGKVVVEQTPPGLPATFNSYPNGQCTFWAAMHFPVPPYLGNAADWWPNAAAKGLPETQTPTVGSVVVYGAGGGYSSFGHVAYVIQVDSPTTFDVSEMNYVGVGIVDERTSTMQDVLGFIT